MNVVGYIPGTVHPERIVLLTAHYDHLGVIDGQLFPGADDNGCFFDGEEEGYIGSEAFAAAAQSTGDPFSLAAIDIDLKLDMIARGHGLVYAVAAPDFDTTPIQLAFRATSDMEVVWMYGTTLGESDHRPFAQRNVKFVLFSDGDDNWCHHTPLDIVGNLPPDVYWGTTEAILEVALLGGDAFRLSVAVV